jgi:hypothetical protein
MQQFTQEPLFEMEEPKQQTMEEYLRETAGDWYIFNENETVTCSHCGDVSPNAVIASISHGRAWNGWCYTRLLCNNGANPHQLEWLASHGYKVCDRFDERNWS